MVSYGEKECSCGPADFLAAVDVWRRRPHVLNRRLLGAVEEREGTCCAGTEGRVLERVIAMMEQGKAAAKEEIKEEECDRKWQFVVRELLSRKQSEARGHEVIIYGGCLHACICYSAN